MASKLNFKKIQDNLVKKAPGLILGAVGSNWVSNGINKMMKDKANPKMTGFLTMAAGALLPGLAGSTGKNGDLMTGIGDGMMANGGLMLLKAMGMPGIGEAEDDAFAGVGAYGSYGAAEDSMYANEMAGTNTENSLV